ncbi:DUF411 domain-containing protein [Azospirillum canadense]|uniref:DUF411 domain-containing protein n=1 Tax=Azospirillum canadense TaxID=403962 RepID=UPI0022271C6D|nr:DUF411 domain-containing protein [Azospirillum canadense]MCW2235697.1 hypothetical protein [Azospirillum canadense]
MELNRRTFVKALTASLSVGALAVAARGAVGAASAKAAEVSVWKSASCGCCEGWVRHMRDAGYMVTVHELDEVDPVKDRLGVPASLRSCHTAVVDGYILEGHVPADSVARLLQERPSAKGLAVPGMPQGAPGMETGVKEPYAVVLFGAPTGSSVYEQR